MEVLTHMKNAEKESDRVIFGFTPYQWFVLFAAWVGWGFDVFDALLFNFVSRLCIPSLLGPGHNDPQTITWWSGILTSVLLIGWGVGGIGFGWITDRIGRTRAMLLTILTYAFSTAACALAPNIQVLFVFRFFSSLGIGGEWAAGASLVAEVMPENKRVQGGALLYTAAPFGLFLATFVTDIFTRQFTVVAQNPDLSWRIVFLTGLIPAVLAILLRIKLKEPDRWLEEREEPKIRELFQPELRMKTIGGFAMAATALVSWWSVNAFIPVVASFLVKDSGSVSPADLEMMKASFVRSGTSWFNLGGLVGTLCTVPIALHMGRRPMFFIYYIFGAAALYAAFGFSYEAETRLFMFFFPGLFVFGIFGSFTFYLPELFPTRLRATGAGFCYNLGRFITALGPFVVGYLSRSAASSAEILSIMSYVALIPALGVLLLMLGLGEETRVACSTEGRVPEGT